MPGERRRSCGSCGAVGGEDAGQRARMHEGRKGKAERQRRIGDKLVSAEQQTPGALWLGRLVRGGKNASVTTELGGDQRDAGDHRDIDHDVLDVGDQRRRRCRRVLGVHCTNLLLTARQEPYRLSDNKGVRST
jgi:hypothetical protein